MKKADIKPGVVYAFQRSPDDTPAPVVFLGGLGQLYSTGRRGDATDLVFKKDTVNTRPSRNGGYFFRTTGYPAAYGQIGDGATEVDALKAKSLAEFEAATTVAPDKNGAHFGLVTHLPHITGEYEAVVAAREAQREARLLRQEEERLRRTEARTRGEAAVTALRAAGISATYMGTHAGAGYIQIGLDAAEKIVKLATPVLYQAMETDYDGYGNEDDQEYGVYADRQNAEAALEKYARAANKAMPGPPPAESRVLAMFGYPAPTPELQYDFDRAEWRAAGGGPMPGLCRERVGRSNLWVFDRARDAMSKLSYYVDELVPEDAPQA